ncbi:carbohydrate-Binding Module family 1 protein [Rutstroemia sp. NJR-2017a WRK4]|nr:carbohydrate-Binding Module family 1 protein [Rutstroemia sp. NJR-2017a WRK4]
MHFQKSSIHVAALLTAAAVQSVNAQQPAWGQYYSQCIPGTATITTPSTTPHTTTKPSTSPTGTPTGTPTTLTTVPVTTTAAAGYPGTTLQSGYYWIRAVESPNFHSYLQSKPTKAAGPALLADRTTAGQFNVVSGQLVQLIAPSTLLYGNVSPPANSSVVKLALSFSTTQNTYGTFAFSGDALTWSVSSINRPNLSAWLVCDAQSLWINLGSYAYNTPPGCVDETIHYFNGATVD